MNPRLIPKELEVVSEHDIYRIVAKKLDLQTTQVRSVANRFLGMLSEEVGKGTLAFDFGRLGDFVYSDRKAMVGDKKYARFVEQKIYVELPDKCLNCYHHLVEPAIFTQGVYNRNMKRIWTYGSIVNIAGYHYKSRITPKELEYYQNKKFFDEDIRYSGISSLRDMFLKDPNVQGVIEKEPVEIVKDDRRFRYEIISNIVPKD